MFLVFAVTGLAAAVLALLLAWRWRCQRAWLSSSPLEFECTDSSHLIIAHACGGSHLGSYPNAVESLDQWHALGVRFFEFDLQATADGDWIGLHDWGPTLRRWFQLTALPIHRQFLAALVPGRPLPVGALRALPMRGGLTPITPESLRDWLAKNPEAWLVTDIKQSNRAGLAHLAKILGPTVHRVVAQVFSIDEISLARQLGYGRVAWANYVPKYPHEQLPGLLENQQLELVVLDQRRLRQPADETCLQALIDQGREIWVFTVNDRQRLGTLPNAVTGVITDRLLPPQTSV